MLNESMIKGKWKEMKGEIRNFWGELTDDDLERTKGNLTSISGLIQQRFGEKKDAVDTKLEQAWAKLGTRSVEAKDKVASVGENLKTKVADATESVKEKFQAGNNR